MKKKNPTRSITWNRVTHVNFYTARAGKFNFLKLPHAISDEKYRPLNIRIPETVSCSRGSLLSTKKHRFLAGREPPNLLLQKQVLGVLQEPPGGPQQILLVIRGHHEGWCKIWSTEWARIALREKNLWGQDKMSPERGVPRHPPVARTREARRTSFRKPCVAKTASCEGAGPRMAHEVTQWKTHTIKHQDPRKWVVLTQFVIARDRCMYFET